MKETLFIINPTSAFGKTTRNWIELRKEVVRRGLEFDEQTTSRAGEAAEIARQALESGVRQVVAVGGDGTLNEVVNGYLAPSGQPVAPHACIGILPSGTGSDFRRSVGISNSEDAITALTKQSARTIDAAQIEFRTAQGRTVSRFYINVASFGLGGDVASYVNRWQRSLPRWIGGRTRFTIAALRALKYYKTTSVRLVLDGERNLAVESHLLVVANGRFAGGSMMLAPDAQLDDGLLDVVVTDRATRLDVIRELPRIRRGGYLKNPKVSHTRARTISIDTAAALATDIDGESVGTTPARIQVLPSAVRFLSGISLPAFHL